MLRSGRRVYRGSEEDRELVEGCTAQKTEH